VLSRCLTGAYPSELSSEILSSRADGRKLLNFAASSQGLMNASQRAEVRRILLSFRFHPAA
jgi:hypothetical protein